MGDEVEGAEDEDDAVDFFAPRLLPGFVEVSLPSSLDSLDFFSSPPLSMIIGVDWLLLLLLANGMTDVRGEPVMDGSDVGRSTLMKFQNSLSMKSERQTNK